LHKLGKAPSRHRSGPAISRRGRTAHGLGRRSAAAGGGDAAEPFLNGGPLSAALARLGAAGALAWSPPLPRPSRSPSASG
jgi:hypothetical protein